MRFDRFIAQAKNISRKEARRLIKSGAATVDDKTVDPSFIIAENNAVAKINGEVVSYEPYLYFLFNKPVGVLSASRDKKCPTVLDYFPEYKKRKLFPAGRLDKDSEGLLLITNDGKLAHYLLSPKNEVPKTYEATTSTPISGEVSAKFKVGITLDDGYKCKSASLTIIGENKALLTLREGKYRQARRMFAAVGLLVVRLKRVKFASLTLPSDLKEGRYIAVRREDICEIR